MQLLRRLTRSRVVAWYQFGTTDSDQELVPALLYEGPLHWVLLYTIFRWLWGFFMNLEERVARHCTAVPVSEKLHELYTREDRRD